MCLHTAKLAVNGAYNVSLGDSPYYLYKHQDVELPITRFMKPRFTYEENLTFEKERQRREHMVLQKVKARLEETTDKNIRKRARKCKDKSLKIGDRVFIKYMKKKGETKLSPKWQGPYRVLEQKNPSVYKLKDLRSGKTSEQHIENMKNQVIAREAEVPLAECPLARIPFPMIENEALGEAREVPEGAPQDDWVLDSYWLNVVPPQQQGTNPNIPPQLIEDPIRPKRKPRGRAKPRQPTPSDRTLRPRNRAQD